MKKKQNKTPKPKVGFHHIVGATRYVIKTGKKTTVFDVFKRKEIKGE